MALETSGEGLRQLIDRVNKEIENGIKGVSETDFTGNLRGENITLKGVCNSMWEDNLTKIIDEKKMYDEEVNSGASKEEIARLREEVNKKLNVEIPNEYLDIILNINGIEFNGFILYGVDQYLLEHQTKQGIYGLVDSNQIWYENEEQKKYLFLGESNISWYVYEYKNKCFIELDNPSGMESNKFNTFYEMFNKILIDAVM